MKKICLSLFFISTISVSWRCGSAWLPSSINKRKPPCAIWSFSGSVLSTWKRRVGVRAVLCETCTVLIRCVDSSTHLLLLSRSRSRSWRWLFCLTGSEHRSAARQDCGAEQAAPPSCACRKDLETREGEPEMQQSPWVPLRTFLDYQSRSTIWDANYTAELTNSRITDWLIHCFENAPSVPSFNEPSLRAKELKL